MLMNRLAESNMFKSHLISLIIFSGGVSIMMAFMKHEKTRAISNYAIKLFLYMVGGVILFSWIMHFL